MARLCKHGKEIGRIELLTSVRSYMSDGTIMENNGFGWKIRGKVKDGITPEEAYSRMKEKVELTLRDRPAFAAYRKNLHDLAGVSKRWKLHAAVGLMPNDPDGVWSEACDGYGDNVCASVDEVALLCRAYEKMETEVVK